ncbi:aryl-alcohol dehydrogenase-like predicted oxidoreductase [Catenulispora sp. MAP5-51]
MAWTLTNPAVSGAIAGFRRAEQVDPVVDAVRVELTEADLAEITGGA